MEFTFAAAGREFDVRLDVRRPDATAADLAAVLDPAHATPTTGLSIDGRVVDSPVPLSAAGLAEGSVVTLVNGTAPPAGADSLVEPAARAVLRWVSVKELAGATGPTVLLIDDAESFEDEGNAFLVLVRTRRPDLHIVAAGRNDGLRSGYTHWTRPLRDSRRAIFIQPNVDYDGDLAGVVLPRRPHIPILPGRGYQAWDGFTELVQAARPEGA
jgi:hypothetical protein